MPDLVIDTAAIAALDEQLDALQVERLRLLVERETLDGIVFGSDVIECAVLGPLCALIDLDIGEIETRLGAVDTMLFALEMHAESIVRCIKKLEAGAVLDNAVDASAHILDVAEGFSAVDELAVDVANAVKATVKDFRTAAGVGFDWLPWALGGAGVFVGGVALWKAFA